MRIEIAILTKSSKHGGFCVAGIDLASGEWVRLTSENESTHGALQLGDMQYEDKKYCNTLDVVSVEIKGRNPSKYQPENVLIDPEYYWEKTGEYSIIDILRLHQPEHHQFLLGNQYSYITEAKIGDVGYSLTLIYVTSLIIRQTINQKGKLKTKASFQYGLCYYENISVTDPEYYNVPDGTKIGNAILVVSLPDAPYPDDRYYKFVAQIFMQ